MKQLKKVTKVLLVIVVMLGFSITLMSSGGGVGVPPEHKTVILTLDFFSGGGSWRFLNQNLSLSSTIPANKEPGALDYFGPTSKPSITKIVQNSYYGISNYYATGGAYPQAICIDASNPNNASGGINSSDPNKQSVSFEAVQVDIATTIWFQVMSQCENGKGLWWKYERQYFPGEHPLTINDRLGRAELKFQYVTTGCLNNGKKYGCNTTDNH